MSQTDVQIPIPNTTGTPMSNDFSIDDILKQISGQDAASGGQPTGGGVGPIPLPIPQKPVRTPPEGITMGAQGHFTSRGEHKRATLGSLMGNITSIITKGIQNQQEKKARQVQFDMERIITILQADPNIQNPQNQKILNDIAGDPKKLKAFQKALGIDFIKPDKNQNAPERKGAQAAFQAAQQSGGGVPNVAAAMGNIPGATMGGGQPQPAPQAQPQPQPQAQTQQGGQGGLSAEAQKLLGMFPVGPRALQMSPEDKLKAEKIKAGLIATADARLKALSDVIRDRMKSQATMSAAQLRVLGGLQIAQINAEARLGAAKIRVEGAAKIEQQRHLHKIGEIAYRHDLLAKEKDPTKQATLIKEQAVVTDGVIKDLATKVKSLSDGTIKPSYDDELKDTKKQLEDMRSYRQTLISSMSKVMTEAGVQSGAATAAGLADEGSDLLSDDEE